VTALTFRDATADDVPRIVAMYADDELGATRERDVDPLPASYWEAFHAIDEDPRHRLVVAEADGGVVGTLQLSFLPVLTREGAQRAQIESVRVAAARRGEGLGRVLFEWAIEQARLRGCRIVQLTTDAARPEAHQFYEGLGFRASHVGMKLELGDRPAVEGDAAGRGAGHRERGDHSGDHERVE
jgi:GNAT superfamily N-acetyltransferase